MPYKPGDRCLPSSTRYSGQSVQMKLGRTYRTGPVSPWRADSSLLWFCCAVQTAAPGLVIPHTKQLGHLGFRGVVAHVQTSGLKAATHVVCMLPAPATPAPSVREFGTVPHPSRFRTTPSMRTGDDMEHFIPVSSRSPQLGAMVTARSATMPTPAAYTSSSALAVLWKTYHAEPVRLLRTLEGRGLSCERYRRAEEFMLRIAPGAPSDWPDGLYQAGIVAQLALSSYLLDVGFPDDWCARHISLEVARSLAYANATGLGYECEETARLLQVLTPYWKWNRRALADNSRPTDDGFTPDQVSILLRALLDHVRRVTGRRVPRGRMRPHTPLQTCHFCARLTS
jgi:hypothetical protein